MEVAVWGETALSPDVDDPAATMDFVMDGSAAGGRKYAGRCHAETARMGAPKAGKNGTFPRSHGCAGAG